MRIQTYLGIENSNEIGIENSKVFRNCEFKSISELRIAKNFGIDNLKRFRN